MKKFRTASGEPPVLHRNSANLMQSMLDEVKANITVLPELKSLIPPLQAGEFEQLEANILRDGCREALLIWQTTQGAVDNSTDDTPLNVLIDGHNRYAICTKHKVDFKVSLREFTTLQTVRDFMIDNQLGRRNLTPEQMSYLRGLKYRNERLATGRPLQDETDAPAKAAGPSGERTRDKLAKEFNVSPSTILRDRDYSEGLDRLEPELKQEVLKGEKKLPKETIREIGRQESAPDAPLTLTDVMSLGKPAAPTAGKSPKQCPTEEVRPADVSTGVKSLVDKISQLANALNPAENTFGADCDRLMALLKEVKKQAK